MPRNKKSGLVKLVELKSGEMFYDFDEIICVFFEYEYDENIPNTITYSCRILNSNDKEIRRIYSNNVLDTHFYRYSGRRDRNSFIAGFNHALKLCTAEMNATDRINAGVEDTIQSYFTMLKEYKKWMKNVNEL